MLLAITSYARSFKEAQAYIIPLMLLCLVPGVICLMPSLRVHGSAGRGAAGEHRALGARSVGRERRSAAGVGGSDVDGVLRRGGDRRGRADLRHRCDSVRQPGDVVGPRSAARPRRSRPPACRPPRFRWPPCSLAISCSRRRWPRSPELSLERRLRRRPGHDAWCSAAFQRRSRCSIECVFAAAWGWCGRTSVRLLAAAVLGLVLWPAAHELFLLNERIGITALPVDQIAEVKAFLEQWRSISPVWILVALAVVPGVCEEFFFRGMFYTSLRTVTTAWRTIVASAVLFGLFHVVTATVFAPERLLPSTFLGLVLGWVRHRTGSVLPCMVLHVLHNGLLLSIVYWRDELAARGFGLEEAAHLPIAWLLLAATGIAVAVALMILTTREGFHTAR